MADGVIFGGEAVEQIREVVRRVLGEFKNDIPQRRRHQPAGRRVWGALIGSMAAPTDASGAPTEATFAVLGIDKDRQLYDTGHRGTIYNHDETLAGEDGYLLKCEFDGNEWSVYWMSCESMSAFSGLV